MILLILQINLYLTDCRWKVLVIMASRPPNVLSRPRPEPDTDTLESVIQILVFFQIEWNLKSWT